MCSRLDPCQIENNLVVPHAVLVAFIMAVYPINVGALMSAIIFLVVQQTNMTYPYSSTITKNLIYEKVETKPIDTKVKPKKPFQWYSLQDLTNPTKSALPSTPTGQPDEPTVVVSNTNEIPSTLDKPSTGAVAMPLPPSLAPSTSPSIPLRIVPTLVLRLVPMPIGPLSALRVSHKLENVNNWLQEATSKLSEIFSTVAGQSSTQALQHSTELDEKLCKILDNQKVIMGTLVHHGLVIEGLTKQVKKMWKCQSGKTFVDKLRVEVARLATAGDLLSDMFLDPDQSTPDPSAHVAPAGQSEEPCLATDTADVVCAMFATPATPGYNDDDIQLVESTWVDAAGDTKMSKAAYGVSSPSLLLLLVC